MHRSICQRAEGGSGGGDRPAVAHQWTCQAYCADCRIPKTVEADQTRGVPGGGGGATVAVAGRGARPHPRRRDRKGIPLRVLRGVSLDVSSSLSSSSSSYQDKAPKLTRIRCPARIRPLASLRPQARIKLSAGQGP
ncbi:hypothetical protein HF086_011751 [Spodoptera exigua]|uniref:Uncharacterized protein n=1 Tax=Spodoptera exigua TaxID=7107 RepID=A0A922MIC0_SPOEX|nr:hypothetical protein HF086_011751 [Spodoptera exigua]